MEDHWENHSNATLPYTPKGKSYSTRRLNQSLDSFDEADKQGRSNALNIKPWRISLVVIEFETHIIFDLNDSVLLGRSYPAADLTRGIDLTPFNAYELGVSRHHAIMKLVDNNVVIYDNKSNNGTLLNGKLLRPDIDYVIKDKDFISLGKMELCVQLLFNPFQN